MNSNSIFLLILLLSLTACTKDTDTTSNTTFVNTPDQRFELLPASQTGIDFSNNITETHAVNIITNSYMYNGGGVAILDINKDDLLDVYFVSSQEKNRLYLNKGGLQFEDITDKAGVGAAEGYKTGVTIVDINADGWDDIYVCRTGLQAIDARRNLLYINNKNQTFTESAAAYGLNDRSASTHANFFDYDADGDLDVYVVNYPIDFAHVNNIRLAEIEGKRVRQSHPVAQFESDLLFENNGDNTFSNITQKAGIANRAFGLSATISDFNGDNRPDIYVGNDYIEPDMLYINNGNGTFTDQINDYMRHTSSNTMGVDIADINNDGQLDVAALDMIAEDNARRKTLMSNMIIERYNTLAQYGYGHQLMRNVLQLNTGGGEFSEIGELAGIANTDWSWSILLADFDNDTRKDAYITNGYRRDVTNLDYLTYTVDSINRTGGITATRYPDFNDFLKNVPSQKVANYFYQNQGDLTFKNVAANWGVNKPSYSNGAAYADLDNDGDLDLVVNNVDETAFVFKNRTREQNGGNFLKIKLKGSATNPNAIGAKVWLANADGKELEMPTQVLEMQTVRGFLSSVSTVLHFGLGQKTAANYILIVKWPDGKMSRKDLSEVNQTITVNHADKGNVGMYEEVAAITQLKNTKPASQYGINFRHQENAYNDFDFQRLLPHQLSKLGPAVAISDVNGDGKDDIFIGGAAGQAGQLYLQSNNKFLAAKQQPWASNAAAEAIAAIFFDADGDKDMDLYIANGGVSAATNSELYRDVLYENDGKGNFTKTNQLPDLRISTGAVHARDIDGDGDQDLLVGGRTIPKSYPSIAPSYILENQGGKYVDATQKMAPEFAKIGMVNAIKMADLDGDESLEIIVTGEWMPIHIFKRKGAQYTLATADFGLQNSNGLWNTLKLADADKDGDIDLLVGNMGANNRFKASKSKPLTLYAADFDTNSSIDPILCQYEGEKLQPIPMRDDLIKQLPGLKKQLLRHKTYAQKSIGDLFPAAALNAAKKLEVKELKSGWFKNDGTGKMTFQPFSNEAQLSAIEDFAFGANRIYFVGNAYGQTPETGRQDASNGGHLKFENGQLQASLSKKDGLWANGDARAIRAFQLGDKAAYLIVNNDGEMQVFVE